MGVCYTQPIENEQHPCPICFDKININLHNRHALRQLTTPCCGQPLHQECWEKSINAFGRCPLCNENLVPEEFMKTIRFCIRYAQQHEGANLNDALKRTCCFAKSPERDSQINPYFLGNTVCFTDDMYWNSS